METVDIFLSASRFLKIKNTAKILACGCTVLQLRAHLESQWKPGMSWENYGKKKGSWNIDHITPRSFFKADKDCRNMDHWSNLQPLWIGENTSKGGKIHYPNYERKDEWPLYYLPVARHLVPIYADEV